jgi:phosphoglycolate phosphatase
VGKGSEHLLTRTLAEVGAPASLYDDAWARYQHHYLAINGQHSQVFPGVVEGLQALRAAGLRLACLTNKPNAFARPLLAQKGLDGFFEQAFGGDAFERKKPDPLPLLKTCEALGTLPQHTLMVGDSSNDAAAARAAGCPVVLVSYGYNHGVPVAAAGADAVVDRMDDIAARLLAL